MFSDTPTLFIVSDGRGRTAEQVLRAALVQFPRARHEIIVRPDVRTPEQVRLAAEEAVDRGAAVFYTLVGEDTRREMERQMNRLLLPCIDLLGPTLFALHDAMHSAPDEKPGLLYESEKEQLDRYDAIDFVLRHDDGQYPGELARADVVLVGVSRTSKSSTCFYLAYEGIRAANVPLVPGMDPIPELLTLPPERVIGLRINLLRLERVRLERAQTHFASVMQHYTDRRSIAREIKQAHQQMEELGWRSIDVSYMAVEEIARRVMDLCGLRSRT
jgi:regulator of PEP synthase PpsR (kinase-PPPase family)